MMKKKNPELSASVLATVLVVSTLMLLGVLIVMNMWQMDTLRYNLYHHQVQARLHTESGFLLYYQDSTWRDRCGEDTTFLLYDKREDSRISVRSQPWGMYEVVQVKTIPAGRTSSRLVGKAKESLYGATLYVPESDYSFSLAGRTFVEGELYLPRNGVAYTQMRSEFFQGRKIENQRLKVSGKEFPREEQERIQTLEAMVLQKEKENLPEYRNLRRSFSEPYLLFEVGGYLADTQMEGAIILYAPEDLFIEQNNNLQDVIVCARKVEIADGFTGCLQVFARDTIEVGDGVCLKQGSGLCVTGQHENCRITLGENNEINGYVIVKGKFSQQEKPTIAYEQPETSKVRGLVFVDGIAEVHGFVTGSLYAKNCYYFAPEGYYTGILYNAVLAGNPGLAYPMFMQGPYERKEVKWLY